MFRKMRRFKQALSREECIDILTTEKRGVLSVSGDNGYPYGVPIDFYYNSPSGKIYFHCAKEGHKLDSVRRNDKVSLTVIDGGTPRDGHWSLDFKSVIVFGRIKEVEEHDKTLWAAEMLCRKFTDDEDYIKAEIDAAGNRVLCLELTPEHISGKKVNES